MTAVIPLTGPLHGAVNIFKRVRDRRRLRLKLRLEAKSLQDVVLAQSS